MLRDSARLAMIMIISDRINEVYLDEISRCCQHPLNKDNILIDTIILESEAPYFQSGHSKEMEEHTSGTEGKGEPVRQWAL